MATGVPSKSRNGLGAAVELSYSGKRSLAAVLADSAVCPFDAVRRVMSPNALYCGENLNALRLLLSDANVCGKVTLVYIDPPFATRGVFLSRLQKEAYEDNLCGSAYVESLRERLILLRELMAPSGSIYVHLDENMVFHMKLVLDEVFGPACYRNVIVRKKCNPKNYTRKAYGNTADFILFYTKSDRYVWNRPSEPLSAQGMEEYHYVEPMTGRRFMKVPVHAPGARNGATGKPWRGRMPPPGKHWQYAPETLEEMDERGEIFWSTNGNPRRKVYLDQHMGVGVQDIWLDFKDAHNQNIAISGYPTEKNPDLLRRIVRTSSNPGDLVLDCFAGSGTTLAVADELHRHWIGIDRSPEAVSTILKRCDSGLLPMGDYSDSPPCEAASLSQPSLFDVLEAGEAACTQPVSSRHEAITDFSIFVETSERGVFMPAIEAWTAALAMGQSL